MIIKATELQPGPIVNRGSVLDLKLSHLSKSSQDLSAFFKMLNASNLRYCHWKSNVRLTEALTGKTDIDLLIDRQQADKFREILANFRFKQMVSPPPKNYPAMEDYLGFEQEAGYFHHLHIHYRMVLGKQHIKAYRLPLEELFLDSIRLTHDPDTGTDVMIPAPEWELFILGLRVLLKTLNRTLITTTLRQTPPVLPLQRKELDFLFAQTTPSALKQVFDAAQKFVSVEEVRTFLDAYQSQHITALKLFQLRRQLEQKLERYRWGQHKESRRAYWTRESRYWLPLWHPIPKKRMSRGGTTIAIIGADGAGKSTLVGELVPWLQRKLDVHSFYLGSKQPSQRSVRIKHRLLMVLGFNRLGTMIFPSQSQLAQYLETKVTRAYARLDMAIAWDRYNRYENGCRLADQGQVVLFDRFPLPELYAHSMDGPRLANTEDRVIAKMAVQEYALYAKIQRPDHIIVLHVSPDVSQARKPDHDREIVTAKIKGVRKLRSKTDSALIHIDADQPFEQVLLDVKQALWDLL